MAFDFLAVVSNGTYPDAATLATPRAAYAVSYGLIGVLFEGVEVVNDLVNNPRVISTPTGSLMIGPLFIKAIQWVDSNADIGDNNNLVFNLDGSTITVKVQTAASPQHGVVFYESNFKEKPFKVSGSMFVTTIDNGQLLIWLK